ARDGSRGDPGGPRDPGTDAVASSRCPAAGRARREPEGRAVHLLLGAAGARHRLGAPAHRVLLGGDMSAKVHLHMHVSDLAKSREFYEKFLGGDPVKVKPGYVKFLPEWAPVNLALSTGGHIGAGTIDHVGVQVESVE